LLPSAPTDVDDAFDEAKSAFRTAWDAQKSAPAKSADEKCSPRAFQLTRTGVSGSLLVTDVGNPHRVKGMCIGARPTVDETRER
jgi:hypothetical protein